MSNWEDITIMHLGRGEFDEPVYDQLNDALRRICLLVDDDLYDGRGSVTLQVKVKRVDEKDEEGDVVGHELAIDCAVKRVEPHRLNSAMEVRVEHVATGVGRVLVRPVQGELFDCGMVELKRAANRLVGAVGGSDAEVTVEADGKVVTLPKKGTVH